MKHLPLKRQSRGFSLLEVVAAIGILSFVLVAILGGFPLGIENTRSAINETRATQLAQTILTALESEPLDHPNLFGTELNLSPDDDTRRDLQLFVAYPENHEPVVQAEARNDSIYRIDLQLHLECVAHTDPLLICGLTVRLEIRELHSSNPPIFTTLLFVANDSRVASR